MKAMSQRQERIAEQIREEIGSAISRGDFSDPRITAMITIPYVWISPDLKHARVFFNTLQKNADMKDLREALNGESYRFQKVLSRLPNKFTPKVKFYVDESADKTARIEDLLYKNRDDALQA